MGIKRTVIITLILLLIPTSVLANREKINELPPDTSGRSGGSRGCSRQTKLSDSTPTLTLLAPKGGNAKVIASPTFAWLVDDPGTWQMEFRLYQYDRLKEEAVLVAEIKDANFKSSPGIVVLSPSQSIPKLAVGNKYLWQVELICDPLHPAGNPFAEAEIEVVEIPPDLKAELAKTKEASKQALVYSKAGFWYDALSIVLRQQNPNAQLNLLLDQVTTSAKEREKLIKSRIHHIQR